MSLVCASFFLGCPLFFARRHLWSRCATAGAVGALSVLAVASMLRPMFEMLSEIDRPGIRILATGSLLLLPLITAEVLRLWFRRTVIRVENLLITANDTSKWSDEWRQEFVRENRERILARSTDIQRDQLRLRNAGPGLLPWFAEIVLGYSSAEIAEYVQADRKERALQLDLARRLPMEGEGEGS